MKALAHSDLKAIGDDLFSSAMGLTRDEAPFHWQQKLLAEFLAGRIPGALDIPTGLGKTAVMAIWLVARLSGANVPIRHELLQRLHFRARVGAAPLKHEEWLAGRPGSRDFRARVGAAPLKQRRQP